MTAHQAVETAQPELSPLQLAESLVAAAGQLSEVIETEVGLLKAFKVAEVERLQGRKKALAETYGQLLGQLSARPEVVAEMETSRRSAVRAAAERLVQATEANAIALRAGIEANGRLMTNIAQAVQAQQPRSESYQADGRGADAAEDKTPVSVSLNEVL